jgi:acylphosphatase
MKKRVHVYYSGTVQGVGFRYTVDRLARETAVSGWVKNIPDGRVELLCEGEETSLKELLRKIKSGTMRNYIDSADVSWSEPSDEFEGFEIRFF